MSAANQNFSMTIGSTYDLTITIAEAVASPGNARWVLAKKPNPAAADIVIDRTVAMTTVGGKDAVEITLSKADTENLAPGAYYHFTEIMDGAVPYIVARGFGALESAF